MENYKNVSQDIRNQLDAEAEAVQIILTEIDNDVYSIVDVCPNACEMWKAIERLKLGESINVHDLETNLFWEFGKFTSCRENQDNTPRTNKETGYDNQMAVNVVGARKNVAREYQKPKWAKDATYHKEKMLLCKQEEAGIQLSDEQVDWRDDTDDEPEDQELEAHYLYMAKIQEVSLDAADNSGPVFDVDPLQKVQNNDDNYNVFANDIEHLEQSESINDTYPDEQGDNNITTDLLDMSTNGEEADQDDDDLARERDLLASLIDKLKCEIDDSKNRNKLLESSNKTLVDKLKEIEDFKNKNKSL
ncbi:hypothetical protein Tco_0313613 [Tanacetum coccineum]